MNQAKVKRLTAQLKLLILIMIVVGITLATSTTSIAQTSTQWSQPIDVTQQTDTEHGAWPALVCDPYQNVHMFWSDMSPTGQAVYYRNNIGGHWSIPTDVLFMPGQEMIRLRPIITPKTDTIHLVWTNLGAGGDLLYSQAPLQGAGDARNWSTPRILVNGGEAGSIAVDDAGVIHLTYGLSQDLGLQPNIEYIQSKDNGITWSDPKILYSASEPVESGMIGQLAIDSAGRMHLGITIRSLQYGVYSEVGYMRSDDGGQTWTPYKRIDASIVDPTGSYSQVTNLSGITPYVFGKDEVHLTWHSPKRMHMWSSDGGNTWSAPIEIMPLGAAFGGPNKLVKDSAGVLHVVTAVQGGVFSASWDGKQWSAPERIEDRGIDPHGQDIVACGGNQLHVIYDDRNDQVKVWYSTRTVDAPPIPAQPLKPLADTAVPTNTVPALSPNGPITVATVRPTPVSSDLKPSPPSPTNLILMAALPVIVLIAAIYLVRRWRA